MPDPNEPIIIQMIQAQLYFGVEPNVVCTRFGVSRTYLRRKCGWSPRRIGF